MIARRRRTKSGSKENIPPDFEGGYGYPVEKVQTYADSSVPLEAVEMTSRDRTGEFLSAVKSLQSRQVRLLR